MAHCDSCYENMTEAEVLAGQYLIWASPASVMFRAIRGRGRGQGRPTDGRVEMSIVEFPDNGGGSVLAQVADVGTGEVTTRGLHFAQTVEKMDHSFGSALGAIQSVANGVLGQLSAMGRRPDEVSVAFGLELTARAGAAVLAAAGGSAHLQVQLTWKASAPQSATQPGAGV